MNAWALTTTARVKAFIGGNFTTAQTTKLEMMIDSVTDFVESYCGRRFIKTVYTMEEYDSGGGEYLVLKNYPVSNVTLYYRNTPRNENDWSTFDTKDYFVDSSSGIIKLSSNNKFEEYMASGLAVTYTAGWDFDNTTTFLSKYAADLEYAVWQLISGAYSGGSNSGIDSERIGDYSVTYSKTAFGDSSINSILDKYTRIEVGGVISPINY